MKPLSQYNSTDIAQICREGDGRFDGLWAGDLVKSRKQAKRHGYVYLLIAGGSAFLAAALMACTLSAFH